MQYRRSLPVRPLQSQILTEICRIDGRAVPGPQFTRNTCSEVVDSGCKRGFPRYKRKFKARIQLNFRNCWYYGKPQLLYAEENTNISQVIVKLYNTPTWFPHGCHGFLRLL